MTTQHGFWTPYRLDVLSRCVAASIGGYVLVNLAVYAQSYILPYEQFKNLLFAMQTGFIWWTLLIIWVFAVRSARKAWLGLAAVALPLLVIDLVAYFTGAL